MTHMLQNQRITPLNIKNHQIDTTNIHTNMHTNIHTNKHESSLHLGYPEKNIKFLPPSEYANRFMLPNSNTNLNINHNSYSNPNTNTAIDPSSGLIASYSSLASLFGAFLLGGCLIPLIYKYRNQVSRKTIFSAMIIIPLALLCLSFEGLVGRGLGPPPMAVDCNYVIVDNGFKATTFLYEYIKDHPSVTNFLGLFNTILLIFCFGRAMIVDVIFGGNVALAWAWVTIQTTRVLISIGTALPKPCQLVQSSFDFPNMYHNDGIFYYSGHIAFYSLYSAWLYQRNKRYRQEQILNYQHRQIQRQEYQDECEEEEKKQILSQQHHDLTRSNSQLSTLVQSRDDYNIDDTMSKMSNMSMNNRYNTTRVENIILVPIITTTNTMETMETTETISPHIASNPIETSEDEGNNENDNNSSDNDRDNDRNGRNEYDSYDNYKINSSTRRGSSTGGSNTDTTIDSSRGSNTGLYSNSDQDQNQNQEENRKNNNSNTHTLINTDTDTDTDTYTDIDIDTNKRSSNNKNMDDSNNAGIHSSPLSLHRTRSKSNPTIVEDRENVKKQKQKHSTNKKDTENRINMSPNETENTENVENIENIENSKGIKEENKEFGLELAMSMKDIDESLSSLSIHNKLSLQDNTLSPISPLSHSSPTSPSFSPRQRRGTEQDDDDEEEEDEEDNQNNQSNQIQKPSFILIDETEYQFPQQRKYTATTSTSTSTFTTTTTAISQDNQEHHLTNIPSRGLHSIHIFAKEYFLQYPEQTIPLITFFPSSKGIPIKKGLHQKDEIETHANVPHKRRPSFILRNAIIEHYPTQARRIQIHSTSSHSQNKTQAIQITRNARKARNANTVDPNLPQDYDMKLGSDGEIVDKYTHDFFWGSVIAILGFISSFIMIIMRGHYSIDIIAGIIIGLLIEPYVPKIDKFLDDFFQPQTSTKKS